MNDMLQDDLDKFREIRGSGGMDTSIPALIELGFGVATALVALGSLVALMLWVPDTVDGTSWMGVSAVCLAVTGIPAGAVYGLRRGGAEMIQAIVRSYAG